MNKLIILIIIIILLFKNVSENFIFKHNKCAHINILTRYNYKNTNCFKKFIESLNQLKFKNWTHFISTEKYTNELKLYESESKKRIIIPVIKRNIKTKERCCPYNKYLNELIDVVHDGWIIIVDDDARFINSDFLSKLSIICAKSNEKDVIIFKSYNGKYKNIIPKKKN